MTTSTAAAWSFGALADRARALSAVRLGCSPAALDLLFVNGWRMDLRAVTALVFAPGEPAPGIIAKLAVGERAHDLEHEHRNLTRLAEARDRDFRDSVPAALAFERQGAAALLLETALRGAPAPARPDGAALARLLVLAVDWLVLFHRSLGGQSAPLGHGEHERLLQSPFVRYRARFAPGPSESAFLERTARAADELRQVPLPLVLQHGDLCLPNLLLEQGRLRVIDWEIPFSPGLPAYDLIHLIACAVESDGDRDGLALYQRAFFRGTEAADAAAAAFDRYASALALDRRWLPVLFTTFWLEYACEKADWMDNEAAGVGSARARPSSSAPGLGSLGLVRIERGTCRNLELLSENERRFILR